MLFLFVLVRSFFLLDLIAHKNCCLALDPNIKTAYAEEKWQQEFFDTGLRRLEEVVSLSMLLIDDSDMILIILIILFSLIYIISLLRLP
jgi:hypothetical protein